jgi:AcrR family transcriptional regulator
MTDSIRDSARINRRDLIIEAATNLFTEQGYTATSVRQISEVVGCTEAALYYHFKEGKRALLQAVLECEMPKLLVVLDESKNATSLTEVLQAATHQMEEIGRERMERMRWILGEFHRLSDEERALFHENHLRLHREMTDLFKPFVESDEQANRLAWIFLCAGFGYAQLFWNLDLQSVVDLPLNKFMESLIPLILQPITKG